ncbi:hypothetical protein GMLC_05450 [Geomonas limicola]|uniref:Ice-binding protein C-terminal domain-containing protein n=1 Tax=Geomonas limicola TaxID=2740186 RepID=A0A6V8N384_9BACT|nr:PEP-CTERM sorting domain-containing protein [Geomonas limicola]GFO66966.1 hypothetical protein GMLC_05450 [Geomonas limicola]
MRKLIASLAAASLLATAVPAFALFTNGGFETGDFSGWTLTGTGTSLSQVITAGTAMQPGQTLDINPYNGLYMARLQDVSGLFHTTQLSQTGAITQADLNSGGKLYVNWGVVLVDPDSHIGQLPPYFSIDILKNGSLIDSFYADASNRQGGGWLLAGYASWSGGGYGGTGDMYYKQDTYAYDFSSFDLGDTLTISMNVADCGYGGHGGFAFLDGIGTTYEPPTVPEPSTLILLGAGLGGLALWRRKQRK